MESPESHSDPRIYLAVERTFLAWIRTGIALMGFGFVISRFGLFLREIAASQTSIKLPHAGFSLPVGVTLIVIGVTVNVVAAIRHYHFVQAIDRGQFREKFSSTLALSVAGLLAVIGVCVAIYLAAL
jgi:inner membrane protein YidH